MSERLDIDDQGEVHYCLDMPLKQSRKEGVPTIDQRACLTDVLKRFGMDDCKLIATPSEPGKSFDKTAYDKKPFNINLQHQYN